MLAKTNIRIVTLGNKRHFEGIDHLNKVKSGILEFKTDISSYQFRAIPDFDWGYSVGRLAELCPQRGGEDILLILATFPIEDNYILKRIGDSRIVVTSFEVGDILRANNIPLKNLILRFAYASALLSKCRKNLLSPDSDWSEYAHADTRGCIFDMTPYKLDISLSCNRPHICQECCEKLSVAGISDQAVHSANVEVNKFIKKSLYWRVLDFAKRRPISLFFVATVWAILIGVISSIIASLIMSTNPS